MDARNANEQLEQGTSSQSSDGEVKASMTDQELQKIKKELGLTDIDSAANPSLSGRGIVTSDDRYPTPFDIPLSEEEKLLLEECTIGPLGNHFINAHATRSPSLAEVADSLIKDLERFDIGTVHDSNNNSACDSGSEGPELEYERRGRVDTSRSDFSVVSSFVSNSSAVARLAELEKSAGEIRQHSALGGDLEHGLEPNKSALSHDSHDGGKIKINAPPIEINSEMISTSTHVKSQSKTMKDVVSRSSSSSIDSGSLPASVDSGLPVKDVSVTQHKYFVVVAIDFGTTFSGYAFSFTRDAESIHMMRKWEGGDPGVSNQKTPTTLLLKPDGGFHSFGFGARDFYHDLEPEESRKWLYFEKFKMALHTQKDLNKSAEIKAANGKSAKAVTVFAHALKFLKDHVIEELTDQSATRILESDIQWVITVPAIWRAPAKQFMRTAAYEAGLSSPETPDQILIALEPEAASIFCRKLRLRDCIWQESRRRSDITSYSDEQVAEEFQGKTRYMVVDCGGGTVDLTVHELNTDTGTLEELHKGTGGACGATGVDEEFEKLLKSIFGKDFIEQFKTKRPAGWVDLMIAFEAKKRSASPSKTNPLNISLPFAFIDYYKKRKSSSIESAVKKFGNPNVKWSSQGMLRIAPETMKELFLPVLSGIIAHIRDLMLKDSVQNIKYLFLVGGFAESSLLQAAIRDAFGAKMRIIIPQDVGLTILKGAVLFGLDPTVVRVRRATMTYGVGVLNRYIPGKHPRQKLVRKNGIEWCTDVFDKFVAADEPVELGALVTRSYAPAKPTSKSTTITIYCTEEEEVTYVTDPGVRKCGHLRIEMPEVDGNDTVKPRELQASMEFGDTEIKVTALDVLSGKNAKAAIDFLSN